MNLYLDTSALVKRYVIEAGTPEVNQWIQAASIVATGLITRAETSAAISKAVRRGILPKELAQKALFDFRVEWPDFLRLAVTEAMLAKADELAWDYSLRGYDAVHLASAVFWQAMLSEPITIATFDQSLALASVQIGIRVVPVPIHP